MKKLFRIFGILCAVVVLAAAGAAIYVKTALPNVGPPPDLRVDITPERVSRGSYLAHHVMLCMDCHGRRDWNLYSGPPVPGSEGAGGEIFDQKMGFPGRFVSTNLTPYGLKGWTDGELFRAITCGVSKDGHALFPVMPYLNYGKMEDEDIYAVIAYLRTLPPIENSLPPREVDFPVSLLINTMPAKGTPEKRPAPSDQAAYGKYVFNAAGCGECHTNRKNGKAVGKYLAGGFEFMMPDGSLLRSPNITPHPTAGIGGWTEKTFVDRFKQYQADGTKTPHAVAKGEVQTLMPWYMYAGMDTLDLKAMYVYLKTVEPVDETVTVYTPAGQ